MLLPRSRYSAPYVPVALSRGRIDLRSEQCKSIPIRTGQEQPSQRVERTGRLGSARIPCQVDIGFGDVVVPGPEDVQFPTLLDGMAAPSVRAYPRTLQRCREVRSHRAVGPAEQPYEGLP